MVTTDRRAGRYKQGWTEFADGRTGRRTAQIDSGLFTVKPFNLAALNVGDFTYKIMVHFILADSEHTITRHRQS